MFFGISLGKILLLAGILLAVWYGFKIIGRAGTSRRRSRGADPDRGITATMRRCPHCGTYSLAAPGADCGNPDCAAKRSAG